MKKFLLIISVFLSLQTFAQNNNHTYPSYNPAVNAEEEFQKILKNAKAQQKRIFVIVGGDWCVWCRRLDSLFIGNKNLLELLNNSFVVHKIFVGKENKNESLFKRFPKIEGVPHIFILHFDGSLLCSQNTEEFEFPANYSKKGHDPEKIAKFLKHWSLSTR